MATRDTGGTIWDAPNQQVVRADQSPPWEEGTGGTEGAETTSTDDARDDLEAMTKEELLARAQELGASPANIGMTKAELIAAVEQAGG